MVKADTNSSASTRRKEVYAELSRSLGRGLKEDVTLAPYTTFGIGGKADFFFQAATPEELVFAIRSAQKLKLRFFILGGGSNILVGDSGFRGLAVKNHCREIAVERNRVICQSGAVLAEVISSSCQCSLSGLEFAAGIPGTVGGAVRGNAGAFGESIGDVLAQAVVLGESGKIKEVGRDFFQFAYRESRLKRTGGILLSATFQLEKRNKEGIAEKIERNLKKRKENLPWLEKSAGCFFKNVIVGERRISAGFLLDKAGAKGMREGAAEVSGKHANIVINSGRASAEDIRRLAQRMSSKVKEKFDIALEEEVVYIN